MPLFRLLTLTAKSTDKVADASSAIKTTSKIVRGTETALEAEKVVNGINKSSAVVSTAKKGFNKIGADSVAKLQDVVKEVPTMLKKWGKKMEELTRDQKVQQQVVNSETSKSFSPHVAQQASQKAQPLRPNTYTYTYTVFRGGNGGCKIR